MGTGAGDLSLGSFQVTLTKEKIAQAVEPPGNIPGKENPQISSCVVKAMKENKGIVYLGNEETATEAKGFELAAGEGLSIDVLGLGKLWFNGTKTGDKLCVMWVGP